MKENYYFFCKNITVLDSIPNCNSKHEKSTLSFILSLGITHPRVIIIKATFLRKAGETTMKFLKCRWGKSNNYLHSFLHSY